MSLGFGLAEPMDPHTNLLVTLDGVTFCPFIYGQCVNQKKKKMHITWQLNFCSVILAQNHSWLTYLWVCTALLCAHAAAASTLVIPFHRPHLFCEADSGILIVYAHLWREKWLIVHWAIFFSCLTSAEGGLLDFANAVFPLVRQGAESTCITSVWEPHRAPSDRFLTGSKESTYPGAYILRAQSCIHWSLLTECSSSLLFKKMIEKGGWDGSSAESTCC